ncbi:hypothetical protein D3C81_1918170 [compost metagenome]
MDVFIGHFNDAPAWNIKKETTAKVIQQLQPPIVLTSEYSPEPAEFILKEAGIKDRKEQEELLVDLNDLKDIKEMQYYYLQ